MLSRAPEQGIMIGDRVEVRVLDVRGDKVRLGIVAPAEVAVHRKEVFLAIQRENRAAACSHQGGLEGALELIGGEAERAEGKEGWSERVVETGPATEGPGTTEGRHGRQEREGAKGA